MINFTKMHGLGNDFVVMNNIDGDISLSIDEICKLADRRFGIGFDQLPEAVCTSKFLTGNDLAMLANVEVLPKGAHAIQTVSDQVAKKAQKCLAFNDTQGAWELLIKQ